MMTWFGGALCVPSAWRSSDSTTMMRVKLGIISSTAGRKDRPVSSSSVCRLSEYVWPPPGAGVLVSAGRPAACCCAKAAIGSANRSSASSGRQRRTKEALLAIAFVESLGEPVGEILCRRRIGRHRCRLLAFLLLHRRQRIDAARRNADHDPLIGHFDDDHAFTVADADAADDADVGIAHSPGAVEAAQHPRQ